MPLLGNKRSSSSSTAPQFPTSTPPKAPPLSQQQQQSAISPNLPVNDYVMSQIKHSLQFLVANQAITPYKSARIGALLDAGTNDEEVLTDMARFKPKAKGESENEEELGPVATWFQDTLSDTLPDLIVTAVGIIGIPLGDAQEEALSALCEQAAPKMAKTLASRESRDNLGKASLVAAKSSQTAMLKGAKVTQNAFKKRPDNKTSSSSTASSATSPGTQTKFAMPALEPDQLEVTLKEAPDDNTRVYTTTLEPEPGKLLSVTHIYQSDQRILSSEEKALLESRRSVPPPPLASRKSTSNTFTESPTSQEMTVEPQAPQSPTVVGPPPPPRHPRAAVMQPF